MMRNITAGCSVAVLLAVSANVARGDCDELKAIALPLTGDTTVTLSSGDVHCDSLSSGEPPEFSIGGGALTLTGPNTATFVNVKFNIAKGASLTFDFDTTEFGPDNEQGTLEDGEGYMLTVDGGALATFNGDMVASGVQNYRSVFYNAGTIEFLGDATFSDCTSSIFRDNTGTLRFRGDATFERIAHLGINNDGGTVSFDKDLSFDTIGTEFDGADGAALANRNSGFVMISGTSVFQGTRSDGNGGALYNEGMIFSSNEAEFIGNSAGGDGGAVYNGGFITFFGEVQMRQNMAASTGGGIAVGGGGSVSFNADTLIQHNVATSTGGGMSILDDSSNGSNVRFWSSASVIDNIKTETALGCNNIYLEPNSGLVGYESDGDICDES